ncbi:Sucrase/ferredoxin-like-domain-containing protein [Geopyxis carbonaria]|nr:Sucrase/ferredoxin-like-domain-containing protein [Geopyxis carbonaria]
MRPHHLLRHVRRPPPHSTLPLSTRRFATRRILVPTTSSTPPAVDATSLPVLPITRTCPPPSTPPCCANPPQDEIDTASPLLGTAPFYKSHILLPTGKHDWPSNIAAPGSLAMRLKILAGAGTLVSCTSFAPTLASTSAGAPGPDAAGAPAAPEYVDFYPRALRAPLPPAGTTDDALKAWLQNPPTTPLAADADELATVLICSHASRDARCGAAAPGLEKEFRAVLEREGVADRVRVAGVSHLGGHKWAGNVVVYSRGWGAWYGRVGVGQVEGIVVETIMGGRLVGGGVLRGVVGAVVGDEVD